MFHYKIKSNKLGKKFYLKKQQLLKVLAMILMVYPIVSKILKLL